MKAWDDIDNDSYMQALTETLRQFSYEDATEHGRLLAIRALLQNLTPEDKFTDE